MNKPVKTKLCWNCEGSVSRTIENCPYCGVYLSPESNSGAEDRSAPSLLKPPYSPETSTHESEVPQAPYQPKDESTLENVAKSENVPNPLYGVFLPVLLLTSGFLSLFFAIILFLFSTDGTLTLQWSADTWYIYGLIALPLLFFGWLWLDRSIE